MAYSLSTLLSLGGDNVGAAASLSVTLVGTTGATVTAGITTGFVEFADGDYLWTYAAFPDGFRGAAKVYKSGVYVAAVAINPQESGFVTADLWTVRGNDLSAQAGSNILTYFDNDATYSARLVDDPVSVGGFLGSDLTESAAGYLAASFSAFFGQSPAAPVGYFQPKDSLLIVGRRPARVCNITIEQGADWWDEITEKDAAGVAVDYTGYAVAMQIRDLDGVLIVELSTESGNDRITIEDGTTIKRALTAEETAALAPQQAVYDMFTTDPDGIVDRLLEGSVEIVARVTE